MEHTLDAVAGGLKTPPKSDTILASESDRSFWISMRQALLMQLDAIERKLGISPTTAEIRKLVKAQIQ